MGAAFCHIPCNFNECKAKDTYVMFGADNCDGIEEVLAHELGHNIGMLEDVYMLDYFGSCAVIAQMHGCHPYNNDIYCSNSDKVWGNLYYWVLEGHSTPEDYFISSTDIDMLTQPINSQGENAAYFHAHYPTYFKDMQ
jgi:hypothetical protein